ncbi:hypothetical protein [Paenibacillus durus]|uniref:Uncharacterized protein n=1 Tax=Paenibacillus durus ATCC 35681 TaxID=1333534 RepID=A0A0F7FAJ3_PAEDU|nr:hypothetical protein [Paenibacillus durus]AKG35645.1 hypothetical protein VK70_14555 [Paenibacillus durus ATCC 35681]
MRFEMIDNYVRDRQEICDKQAAAQLERDSALETTQALKAEYEAIIRESLYSGEDVSSKLDAVSDKIVEAERVFLRKDTESRIAQTAFSAKTTPEDVVTAWNADFQPRYFAELIQPARDELLSAKLAYIDAYTAYRKAVREFDDEKDAVLNTMYPGRWPQPHRYEMREVGFANVNEGDTHRITGADLYDLDNGRTVQSVLHVKRGDK